MLLAPFLSYADMSWATGVSEGQFDKCKSLEGATMPDGQKYEDWLKDKQTRGENGENNGRS